MEDTNQLPGLWSYKQQLINLPTPHSLLRKTKQKNQNKTEKANVSTTDWKLSGYENPSADRGIQRCWRNRKIICLLKCIRSLHLFQDGSLSRCTQVTRHYGDRTLPGTERSAKNLGRWAQRPYVGCMWCFTRKRTAAILKDREDVSICLKSARAISGSW